MVIFNNVVNVRNSNLARSYSTYHDFIKLAFTLCDDASGQVSVMFFLGFFFAKLIWIIFVCFLNTNKQNFNECKLYIL